MSGPDVLRVVRELTSPGGDVGPLVERPRVVRPHHCPTWDEADGCRCEQAEPEPEPGTRCPAVRAIELGDYGHMVVGCDLTRHHSEPSRAHGTSAVHRVKIQPGVVILWEDKVT